MANFSNSQAILYAPAGGDPWKALSGTTHLGVGAHPDDLEFMGWHPILECFDDPTKSFSGVIVSDGRSAPRAGRYAGHDDQAMVEVRRKEQQHAAVTG
ncbi:MAG: PIG-L family deacetylase, partial [Candidatus Eremiobacteraeota bacterium]|nr:PIG-L family deacetylase [Candidatus Eremiobacteraeota bacterium]